MYMKPAIQQP